MSHFLPDLEDTPAGYLLLGADGTILHAPLWLDELLAIDAQDPPSIFELFSPRRIPHLRLHRVFRHPSGSVEYHLRVHGLTGRHQGLRYWPAMPPEGLVLDEGQSLYMLIDDSGLIQTHAWEIDHLRRAILRDVQDALSGQLKNRQTTIQLLVETLRDAPELVSESLPRLQRSVADFGDAINRIVDGLQGLSPAPAPDAAPFPLMDLPDIVESWGSADIDVRCSLKDVDPDDTLPPSSIERILRPVVNNAVDASRSSSTVEVILSVLDDDFAHFEVIDDGNGMDRRHKSRAPDPFFTTKVHRLGLGLAHAHRALHQLGGQWRFDSAADRGTRVTLLLPLATPGDVPSESA